MRISRFAVVALLVAIAGQRAFADPVVDQSFTPSLPTGIVAQIGQTNLVDWAQTFTVGITGTLTSFDVAIRTGAAGATSPLLVDLRTTTGGVPSAPDSGANILFSTSATGLSTSFTTLSFTVGVSVTAGDVLAIVLRSDDPASPSGAYEWPGTAAGAYAGGSAFRRIGTGAWGTNTQIGDLWFRTTVDAGTVQTPEPALLALLATGLCLVGWHRRRAR